jgi:hypothetical protein
MDEITIQVPAAVRLEAQHLVIPAHLGRYMIGELLRAFGAAEEEVSNEPTEPTHLAYSQVLGMVPVTIVACNASACMVRGYVNGRVTGPVRVSKGDLFPRLEALEVPPRR